MTVRETYLGDGLYASHDGYQLKLRAPCEGGDHEVYLEEAVWRALLKFMAQEADMLLCEGCGINNADLPSKLCVGCQAYREHQA